MTACPSCHVELNTNGISKKGVQLLCSACRTLVTSDGAGLSLKQGSQRISGRALFSFLISLLFATLFGFGCWLVSRDEFKDSSGLIFIFFIFTPAMMAVPFGLRSLDDINLPHKKRWGSWLASFGASVGLAITLLTVGLIAWSSTEFFAFRMNSSGGMSIGNASDSPRSIFADMPNVRENEAYRSVLDEQSTWRWLFPGSSVDPETHFPGFHSEFANPEFDDSEWPIEQFGEMGIGYGDVDGRGYGVKLRTPGNSNRFTAYLRTRFTTTQTQRSMAIEMCCDDGAIIYIDGTEVARHNMRRGPDAYKLMASQAIFGADEEKLVTILFDVGRTEGLTPGEHVLAISLHNSSNTSSDLGLWKVAILGSSEPMSSTVPNEPTAKPIQ